RHRLRGEPPLHLGTVAASPLNFARRRPHLGACFGLQQRSFPTRPMSQPVLHAHSAQHAFTFLNPRATEGLVVRSRRSMLKASLAGLAGLTLPNLLRVRAEAATANQPIGGNKAVILLWMTGGPSHIDTWDPKPDMPREIRGPF